jgi:hypothetical protein
VTVAADTFVGAAYAMETVVQLVRVHGGLPAVRIDDAPLLAWRGLMLDAGRRFFPVPLVHNILDTMAASKLNVLHWHLVDSASFPCGKLGAMFVGESSLFYWALGVAPSKDDYWTTEVQPGNPYGDKPTEPNWQLQALVVGDTRCGRILAGHILVNAEEAARHLEIPGGSRLAQTAHRLRSS